MKSESGVAIKGELTIDTRPIEEVHADLIRKRNQVHARQQVINDARALVENSKNLDQKALLAILNRDTDEVSSTELA